jgi:hypothetical protein
MTATTRTASIAVIGTGAIAQVVHLPILTRMRGVEVVGLFDADTAKARTLADRFSVPKVYRTLEEVWEDENTNAVVVCTPNHLHEEQVIAGLQRGEVRLLREAAGPHRRRMPARPLEPRRRREADGRHESEVPSRRRRPTQLRRGGGSRRDPVHQRRMAQSTSRPLLQELASPESRSRRRRPDGSGDSDAGSVALATGVSRPHAHRRPPAEEAGHRGRGLGAPPARSGTAAPHQPRTDLGSHRRSRATVPPHHRVRRLRRSSSPSSLQGDGERIARCLPSAHPEPRESVHRLLSAGTRTLRRSGTERAGY